jgi:hypothetical protein
LDTGVEERLLEGLEVALKVVPVPVAVDPAPVLAAPEPPVPLAVGAVVEGRTGTSLQERS